MARLKDRVGYFCWIWFWNVYHTFRLAWQYPDRTNFKQVFLARLGALLIIFVAWAIVAGVALLVIWIT